MTQRGAVLPLLQDNLERLDVLEVEEDPSKLQHLVDFFLDDTFEIGRSLELDPSIADLPEFQAYLEESNRRLGEHPHRIQTYVDRTTRKFGLGLEEGEFTRIARRRSAVAFLVALSDGTPFAVAASLIDPVELDDAIEASGGGYLEPDQIPSGVPASHWWWWYPDSPPPG